MKKNHFITLALAVSVLFAGCADYYLKKGDKEFNNLSYVKAVGYYKKSLEKKESIDARVGLANSYRLMNDTKNASAEYAKLIDVKGVDPINYFYFGKTLMQEGLYDDARRAFLEYLKDVPDDIVAHMLLASCRSIDKFKIDTTLYSLQQVKMEDVATMFGANIYGEGIIFTADKAVKLDAQKSPWTGRSYLDLYFSQQDAEGKWLSPQLLKGDINGEYHEGPATFNKAANVVYFTRSNYFKKKLEKSSKNENNLKIFKASLVDGKWTKLEEMPFNSDEYSVGHPCLSPDEKTLYFISDMPGGEGGTDIYKSTFDGKSWSKPENLGRTVNTTGNEMFPYYHSDGSFYFASDAHNSMGGLDVFVTSRNSDKWLRPENLNYPLNSSKDDFALVLSNNDTTGFISSNRTDTDQVYKFTKHPPKFWLEGMVIARETKKPIMNATVELDYIPLQAGGITLTTDAEGKFKTSLSVETSYSVFAAKIGYFSLTKYVSTKGKKVSETLHETFELDWIVLEKPIVLKNIYYDLDKWEIRPDAAKELDKLVKLLQDNPTLYIELSSHTDSRAGDQYNLILSDKRAKAAVKYLISKGIDDKRLTWKGYGESMHVNNCSNDVKCSEDEHQKNRRTEFKVKRK